MNEWIGTGRVQSEVKLVPTRNGGFFGKFVLKVPRGPGRRGSDFVHVRVSGWRLNVCRHMVQQGARLRITGPLHTYGTKELGQECAGYEILARKISFLDQVQNKKPFQEWEEEEWNRKQ